MPAKTKVLLVGEDWMWTSNYLKGFDAYASGFYVNGGEVLMAALKSEGVEVTHLPTHDAARDFPFRLTELQAHHVIILSDIGANTLVLPPQVFLEGTRKPNRLRLIRDYTLKGGGLVMAGGYFSFQGLNALAGYKRTAIADVLPVSMLGSDDRIECPEGVIPKVVRREHFITKSLEATWPYLLGFNEVTVKAEAELLATIDDYPLLVAGAFGKGRSVAWMSDVGPHWCSKEFLKWSGYKRLWKQIVRWVAGSDGPH